MPSPVEGMVRVFPHVHVDGLRPGQWADIPIGKLDDLVSLAFVSLVDDHGNGPPVDIVRVGCC